MTQYTPNLQIPYPEAGDAPRGNEQMQAIAEAIEARFPTAWNPITPAAGIEGTDLAYRINGARCELRGSIQQTNGAAFSSNTSYKTYTVWDAIPDSVMPVFSTRGVAISSATVTPAVHECYARPNGTMSVTLSRVVYGSATWLDLSGMSWPII